MIFMGTSSNTFPDISLTLDGGNIFFFFFVILEGTQHKSASSDINGSDDNIKLCNYCLFFPHPILSLASLPHSMEEALSLISQFSLNQ